MYIKYMTDRARKRRDAWRKTNKLNGTFNTHEAVKALKSSGFDEKQAESVVETINKAVNETVATKADLEVMASKLATKEELKALADKMATKDELKVLTKTVEDIQENIKENMATKAELKVLTKTVEGIQENIEKNMATKTDLANLETRMLRMMIFQTLVLVGLLIPVIAKLLL